jgi:prevent-host-death family protein
MKTATLRQLRNETGKLVKWVEAGETVVVTKRSKPLFRLLPVLPEEKGPRALPDFARRQREIFPEGMIPVTGADMIAEERDRY